MSERFQQERRTLLRRVGLIGAGAFAAKLDIGCAGTTPPDEESTSSAPAVQDEQTRLFSISLAQWSLHRAFFGPSIGSGDFGQLLQSEPDSVLAGEWDAADFPRIARDQFGIEAVEYVNTFFFGKASDNEYLGALKRLADDAGVKSLLIMCDALGELGAPNAEARSQAVARHEPWLEAAAFLGCHSIRVNAASEGSFDEQQRLAADGLHSLAEKADPIGLNVLVENHGGLSSNGTWLAGVMAAANHPRLGTLPDFGNFNLGGGETYDRYQGVEELMPYARAVSAKSNDFDDQGNEIHTDYERMLRIVLDAGYRGPVGIEYEGSSLPEPEGILATKALLESTRDALASDYA